jgi:hypothetical protein
VTHLPAISAACPSVTVPRPRTGAPPTARSPGTPRMSTRSLAIGNAGTGRGGSGSPLGRWRNTRASATIPQPAAQEATMWFFVPIPRVRRRCRRRQSAEDQRINAMIIGYLIAVGLIFSSLQAISRACGVDTNHPPAVLAAVMLLLSFGLPAAAWWGLTGPHERRERHPPWWRDWELFSPARPEPPPPPPPPPPPQPFDRRMPKDRPYPWRPY